MGRDFAERWPAAAEVFEQANAIVGYDLRKYCFEGPAESLERTSIQQPAIFTTSVAIWTVVNKVENLRGEPVAMAGLSLGEYTALYAAGSLSFADGLRLVQKRGELMQQAAEAVPSGMVSIMGLDVEKVEAICAQACEMLPSGAVMVPANFNCPGQIVVSGSRSACEAILPLVEQAGGRAIPLKVAGAFHSPLMKPAAQSLQEVLQATPVAQPRVPVVANVNCENHRDAGSIRQWLADQLTHPVRWQASMERLLKENVDKFVEIGPGRVLTGLMKKIARSATVANVSTAANVEQLADLTA